VINDLSVNYWTHSSVFCTVCDGDREVMVRGRGMVFFKCKSCAGTGREPIPWTELFPGLRVGEPRKQPL
jgi:hypothetical protein